MVMPGPDKLPQAAEASVDILEELKSSRPVHPALGRLHDRLVGTTSEREITSYDRMHHRHSRR